MKGQAAAYKEKLQEATAGQAQAARLAAELEVEQTVHKEAKSQLATVESRYTLLTLLRQQSAVGVHLLVGRVLLHGQARWQISRLCVFG